VGGVREVGEEGAGSGIPKVQEVGEIGKITQHSAIFRNRESTKGRESRFKDTGSGKREAQPPTPVSCPPPTHTSMKHLGVTSLYFPYMEWNGKQQKLEHLTFPRTFPLPQW